MSEIREFLGNQHQLHLNNAQQAYYAECYRQNARPTRISIMPSTPFVFEFFIFNSLYHYDWETTFAAKRLVSHDEQQAEQERGLSEAAKQARFERFIRERCKANPQKEIINRAFGPLASLNDLEGAWTTIRSGTRLSENEGDRFFAKIRELQQLVITGQPIEPTKKIFDLISDCRYFIFQVRNNIFHGSKALGTLDNNQSRRVEVYQMFIQCLISLFFLTCDYESAACDTVCLPIKVNTISSSSFSLGSNQVLELVVKKMMKPEDCRLIPWAHEILTKRGTPQKPEGALFYPSAGNDVITPILLGLPFCTEFHFYDTSRKRDGLRQFFRLMRLTLPPNWEREEPVEFSFEFDGHLRKIRFTRGDNLDFLKTKTSLLFFFRRGDSDEGGSSHRWENELFQKWRELVPTCKHCYVLTDGTPGGIHNQLQASLCPPHKFPNSERGRGYYCGVLH